MFNINKKKKKKKRWPYIIFDNNTIKTPNILKILSDDL